MKKEYSDSPFVRKDGIYLKVHLDNNINWHRLSQHRAFVLWCALGRALKMKKVP